MRWIRLSGHGSQRRASSTFYSCRDASQNTPPTVATRVSSVRFAQRALSEPLHPKPECRDECPSGKRRHHDAYIGGCVPTLFIFFSLVYSRAFGKDASRRLLELISLLVDSLAFTLVFVLPCLVLPFWVGLLVRYASPFTTLGTSSR